MLLKQFSEINNKKYDVIVIGAGHAGIEAASASARIGVSTLLITLSFQNIGELSCNPSIGGLAKGHLVAEIDALGGLMGYVADISGIQFRILNRTKGEAVQGLRAQIDRDSYKTNMTKILSSYDDLDLIEGEVININLDNKVFKSVIIQDKTSKFIKEIPAKSVIITTGTFLNGLLHFGDTKIAGGRVNMYGNTEQPTSGISIFLKQNNIRLLRLKTGTPARLDKNTINYTDLEEQKGDSENLFFSNTNRYNTLFKKLDQISCYITHTKQKLIDLVKDAVKNGLAPMYNGEISGIGPRYCPSIEDKIMRFPDHKIHHVFLEPEGLNSNLIYPNGLSTSLPNRIQDDFFKAVNGLENAKIIRYGYAVEYDAIDPTQLYHNLQIKSISGVFTAGQINGTSGYEEAAAQGIVAGINAGLYAQNKKLINFSRTNSYIGVLINDITTTGIDEPYRMFTSRSEYRLSIRQDNADQRLTPIAIELGLISKDQETIFKRKIELLNSARHDKKLISTINTTEFIKNDFIDKYGEDVLTTIRIEEKYSGYLKRQANDIEKYNRDANCKIQDNIDYNCIPGLSIEMREKLLKYKPETLADAQFIPGITPSALTLLLQYAIKR